VCVIQVLMAGKDPYPVIQMSVSSSFLLRSLGCGISLRFRIQYSCNYCFLYEFNKELFCPNTPCLLHQVTVNAQKLFPLQFCEIFLFQIARKTTSPYIKLSCGWFSHWLSRGTITVSWIFWSHNYSGTDWICHWNDIMASWQPMSKPINPWS